MDDEESTRDVTRSNEPLHNTNATPANIDNPDRTHLRTALSRIFWTPAYCRYNPEKPPTFSLFQNVLFALAGAATVANLYYSIAILNVIARDFNVSYLTVSRIPTLAQSGYAVGLFLICPLGDLFPRRPFTLCLVFLTATLWIGLCITKNFNVFLALSFITSITTVTPQIMLPLVGELAPANKRPLALSIVVSGNLLGMVTARVLSGVVANYTSWRNIYLIALALQYAIFIALYLFMPAYPSTNPLPATHRFKAFMKTYPQMLWSLFELTYEHPVLVQAGMISFCMFVSFTCFWTTLTFLLSSTPYELSPTPIGLFGLIGIAGIFLGPLYAKYLIQPLGVPLYAVLIGQAVNLIGSCVGTYTGKFFIGGPIIQALGLDCGLQITQIANRTTLNSVAPNARNRVNTVFMLFTFFGQITGTAAGNELYERYGGWMSSGSLGVALVLFSFVVVLARGPWEDGWIGWTGGWGRRSSKLDLTEEKDFPNVAEKGPEQRKNDGHAEMTDITRLRSDVLSRMHSHGSDGHAI